MKALALILICASLLGACGRRKTVKPLETPTPAPTPQAALPEAEGRAREAVELASYTVREGDCLWDISAKSSVFGDPFHWPLLYRQNRDQITDPDLIEPDWELSYRRSYSDTEVADAVRTAEERPPYVPRRRAAPVEQPERY